MPGSLRSTQSGERGSSSCSSSCASGMAGAEVIAEVELKVEEVHWSHDSIDPVFRDRTLPDVKTAARQLLNGALRWRDIELPQVYWWPGAGPGSGRFFAISNRRFAIWQPCANEDPAWREQPRPVELCVIPKPREAVSKQTTNCGGAHVQVRVTGWGNPGGWLRLGRSRASSTFRL